MKSIQNSTPKERIILIDSLRGYALMGLFLIHMIEYFEVYWYKPEPSIYKDLMFFLFGGKSYAIFALLFGLSFYIIMDRQKQQGVDFRSRFCWRVTILLIAGILHVLIYGGDILQVLALAGFLLVPLYKARKSLLLALSAFLLLQIPSIIYYIIQIVQQKAIGQEPLHWSLMRYVHSIYANGSFTDVLNINTGKGLVAKWTFLLETGRLSTIIGMSFLGFLLGKIKFFIDYAHFRKKYQAGAIIALLIFCLLYFGKPTINSMFNPENYWIITAIINSYVDLAFTFASVFVFILLYQLRIGQKILGLLAHSGRMSLTIYIMQSIIFVPFFYGFGLGTWSYIGQTLSFYTGVLFWIIQVWLSFLWIKRYYYGPLEWLWRSATYLRSDISFKRK